MENIDVIAYIDKNGDIRPMKVRLQENEELIVFKINRLIHANKGKFENTYKCEVIINDIVRVLTLIYNLNTTKWYIKK